MESWKIGENMKIDAFCAWGDGPDVGINITFTEEEIENMYSCTSTPFKPLLPIDLTVKSAKKLGIELIQAAMEAEELNQICEEHDNET